jgi:hypothetical protein
MSEIEDEAYSEAMDEIERLKRLNSEERVTIEELSDLVIELVDTLEIELDPRRQRFYEHLILKARLTAGEL